MIKKIVLNNLISLYGLCPYWGKKIIQIILTQIDGGEFWSLSLRQIYSKYHDITIGIGSYGCFDTKRIPKGTKIGNYCSFGSDTWIYNLLLGYVRKERISKQKLSIGHDVWIGHGALILLNVSRIATGSIVSAGSVVTKNVEPFQIVGGNPSKEIRKRFSADVCRQLLESEWFLKSPTELLTISDFADNPNVFFQHLREVK